MIAPAWRPALEAAARAPLTLVIGPVEAGKTTLVAALANALHAAGLTVALVDADLGQSEIGPPTTVGLGRVTRPLARPADAELVAMHFVGVTSPAANLAGALVGVRRMVDRARALGAARVVVDTSGLVAGELGRTLKQAKIELLDPDLVIALQRGRECEHILGAYAHAARPAVVRLPALAAPRTRSAEDRRRRREERLRAYFAGARRATLDLRRVALRAPPLFTGAPLGGEELAAVEEATGRRLLWGERRDGDVTLVAADALADVDLRTAGQVLGARVVSGWARGDLEGVLAGLEGCDRATVGLAVVRSFDLGARAVVVDTPVAVEAVAALTLSRERYPG